MTIFNINFNELLHNLLPSIWKNKPITENDNGQWLISLIKPIKTLCDIFYSTRDESFYNLNHSGQVLVLEHYINSYFGLPFSTSVQNDMYIETIINTDENFLFKTHEQISLLTNDKRTLYLKSESLPLYIYANNEYDNLKNFSINVPSSFSTYTNFENIMFGLIDNYRAGGLIPTILYY